MFGCCRPHCAEPRGCASKSFRTSAGNRLYGIITGVSGIYDEPELYELACAYRDIPAEVTAVAAWCAEHHPGPAASVL